MKKILFVSGLLALSACMEAPSYRPAQGRGALWGHVRLVRREGLKPIEKNDPVYADRRLPEQTLVDYRKPGFVVVYLEGQTPPGGIAAVSLVSGEAGRATFSPDLAAVGVGGKIVLKNDCATSCVVSCQRANLLRRVQPGEEIAIEVSGEGTWELFTMEQLEAKAVVFAANGPYSVVSESGEWRLPDLLPGAGTVRTWHPRFPPAARTTQVTSGSVERIDMDVGVENLSKEAAHESSTTR